MARSIVDVLVVMTSLQRPSLHAFGLVLDASEFELYVVHITGATHFTTSRPRRRPVSRWEILPGSPVTKS